MPTLENSKSSLRSSAAGTINLSLDLVQSYGAGFESDVVDLCIGAIRSVSIASGAKVEDAEQCRSQFLKNYSQMSKSGIEVSSASITGAFRSSLKPEMRRALDSMLTVKNMEFVSIGSDLYKGEKQEGAVRRHHSSGADFSM